MENLIKQSNVDKSSLILNAQKLAQQLRPLKHTVDGMRSDLGLEKLDDLNIDESKFIVR